MTSDRPPRGAHILDAACTVLAEQGAGALSMRRIATASGVSLAQVQYYFRTKDELIRAAFSYVGDRFLATLDELDSDAGPSWQRLRAAVWLWLPLDRERELAARVWLAFSSVAVSNKELAAEAARQDAELRAWFTEDLSALQARGHMLADVDTATTAAQLLALIDGVTLQALVLPMDLRHELATTTIERFLHPLTAPTDA